MTTKTIKNNQTTQERLTTATTSKETRRTLTANGLKALHAKALSLSLKAEDKEASARKISAIVSFTFDNMTASTLKPLQREEILTIMHDLDNLHYTITNEFSNLLRNTLQVILYSNNKCYEDYNKPHEVLSNFKNRKLFMAIQNQLLNSNYFIISYNTCSVSNFINGTTETDFNINNAILRPLPPSNNTREILESQGITFYDKVKDTEQDAQDWQDRREQAYAILKAEGLDDLLN